jgi:PAS domain S-box-containing protein
MRQSDIDPATLLEAMSESILVTDTQLDAPGPFIIYVNPSFEKMTGWSRAEIIGKSPRVLQGPKTDLGIFDDLKNKLLEGKPWSGRTINYRKDGNEFYMDWSITPVLNASGEIYQYLAVQKEVTQVVLTELKLQEARQVEKERLVQIQKINNKLNNVIAQQNETLALFKKYVPEAIIHKSLSDNEANIRDGEQLEVALLFCDIRGFTAIADRLKPDEVVVLLNTFYSEMSEVIIKYDGEINEFVGDEIFVTFGAPLPISKPALASVQCALAMIENLDRLNNKLKQKLDVELTVGIGIHFGPVIAGNLGSRHKLEYSVTGSAVITAKRVEALTRDVPNAILITGAVFEKVHTQVRTKSWGKVPMKGRDTKIDVFQVLP